MTRRNCCRRRTKKRPMRQGGGLVDAAVLRYRKGGAAYERIGDGEYVKSDLRECWQAGERRLSEPARSASLRFRPRRRGEERTKGTSCQVVPGASSQPLGCAQYGEATAAPVATPLSPVSNLALEDQSRGNAAELLQDSSGRRLHVTHEAEQCRRHKVLPVLGVHLKHQHRRGRPPRPARAQDAEEELGGPGRHLRAPHDNLRRSGTLGRNPHRVLTLSFTARIYAENRPNKRHSLMIDRILLARQRPL
jgi:hypothetical protein